MRQLVLVEDFSTPSAVLAAHLAAAELPDQPVVVFLPARAAAAQAPAVAIDALPDLHGEVFDIPGREGLLAVTAHHGGHFPERLDQRSRALLNACDTVVARCPQRDAVTAARFYSSFVYALDGQLDPLTLRSATAHLLGLVDRARNKAARERHDRLDEAPLEPFRMPTGEAARLSNSVSEGELAATVFETAYGELPVEMARLGFDMTERKTRDGRGVVSILVGSPGIAIYGPYIGLEEGDYCYRVEIDGGGRDIAFTLEAAWSAGAQVLAVHDYALSKAGRLFADLGFTVAAAAAGRAVELRLWNSDASAQFDIVRLSLVRMARP